jgi:hypothetical protein
MIRKQSRSSSHELRAETTRQDDLRMDKELDCEITRFERFETDDICDFLIRFCSRPHKPRRSLMDEEQQEMNFHQKRFDAFDT